MDLAQLYEQAVGQQQARMRGADNEISNVNNLTGEMVNIMQSSANASRAVGEATASEVEAKGVRELAADAERKRLEAAMLNPLGAKDLTDFMGQVSVKIAAQKEQLDAERAQLVGKMETKFTDDPVAWITNAFTVPDEVRTYNAKYEGLKGEMEFQAKVDSALRSGLSTQKALEASTSTAEVAASANKARNMAEVVALSAQHEAMRDSLTAVTFRNSLLNSKADAARDILSSKLQILANARADESLQMQREENADRKAARAEKLKNEDDLAKVLPLAFAAHGLEAGQGTVSNWKKLSQVDKDAADSILKFAIKVDMAKSSSSPNAAASIRLTEEPVDAWALVKNGVPLQGNGAQAAWLKEIDGKTLQVLHNMKFADAKGFQQLDAKKQAEIYRSTFNQVARDAVTPNPDNMKVSAAELGVLKIGGELLVNRVPQLSRILNANPLMKGKEYAPEEIMKLVQADIKQELVRNIANRAQGKDGVSTMNLKSAYIQEYSRELADLFTAKKQSLFVNVQPHLLGAPIDPKSTYNYSYQSKGFIFDKASKADLGRADHIVRILLKEDTDGLK